MKNYYSLFTCCLLAFLLPSTGFAQNKSIDYYPPSPVPDRIVLNLTDQPATSIAITWRTAITVQSGFVQIALADPSPDFRENAKPYKAESTAFLSDQNGASYHSVRIDGLQPNTSYAYRVGDNIHWSEWNHFQTATTGDRKLSMLYFGDAQNELKSMWSRVVRGAYKTIPEADFWLHAGDLVNIANSDREWGEWYEAAGWINRTTPSISTPGNHEYGKNPDGKRGLSRHWRKTFNLPINGPEGLEETVFYLDYEHVRIISLNTPAFLGDAGARKAQIEWLKKVLDENPQTWTLVTMHHPVYSSKFGRQNDLLQAEVQPILEQYKVDLVLQGHDHTYSRGTNIPLGKRKKTLDGPMYVVSVSGPKMYDLGLEDWVQRAASNTQLYQAIDINDDVLSYQAYTATGELYDAFELKKNKKEQGPNIFKEMAPENVEEHLELPKRFKDSYDQEDWAKFNERFKLYKMKKEK